MATHFRVRNFIRYNPQWAVVIAGAFFANGFGEEPVLYPEEPFNVAICQIYINTNGEIVREDYPITTDMFDHEIFDKFADICMDKELTATDAREIIEEAVKDLGREAIKENMDTDLATMLYVDEVGEDEFGTKTMEVRVKDDVNSIAVSFMAERMLEEIYDLLV